MDKICYFTFLLGVSSVNAVPYEEGPPASIYALPEAQEVVVTSAPPQGFYEPRGPPPFLEASFEVPAPPTPPAPVSPLARQLPLQPPQLIAPAPTHASYNAPPAAPEFNIPAEIYGAPAVQTDIAAAPPSPPDLPQNVVAAPPSVIHENITPLPPPSKMNTPSEIYVPPAVVRELVGSLPSLPKILPIETPAPPPATFAPFEIPTTFQAVVEVQTPADIYGVPVAAQKIVAASPTQSEIRPIEGSALSPFPIAPYKIPTRSQPLVEIKTLAETYSSSTAVIELAAAQQSIPEVRQLAPTSPSEVPASPPQLPEVDTPSEVYGPPSLENEIVPAPPSPPETPTPEFPAKPGPFYGPPLKGEILIAPPSEPPFQGPEIPTEAPKKLPTVYGPPVLTKSITMTIVVAPRPFLIKFASWKLPIPRPFGSPVYGLPSLPF